LSRGNGGIICKWHREKWAIQERLNLRKALGLHRKSLGKDREIMENHTILGGWEE
jgi:hypothetical protein